MPNGKLYLIPTTIADGTQSAVIPPQVLAVLPGLTYFLAENIRTARRYLSSLKIFPSIEPLHFELLNKDTSPAGLPEMFSPLFNGHSIGLLSESGCPGIADPGSIAVEYAHRHQIEVVPLVGPSSILMALMASGFNGQKFCFHGYLPVEGRELTRVLKELEKESAHRGQTQIFIETPYRNNQLVRVMLNSLNAETQLCIATDITGASQSIKTHSVREWKNKTPEFPKIPAVFLILAGQVR